MRDFNRPGDSADDPFGLLRNIQSTPGLPHIPGIGDSYADPDIIRDQTQPAGEAEQPDELANALRLIEELPNSPSSDVLLSGMPLPMVADAFRSRFPESGHMLDGYLEDQSGAFRTGITAFDAETNDHISHGKKVTLARIITNVAAIERGGFLSIPQVGDRRTRREMMYHGPTGGANLNETFDHVANRAWVDRVIATSHAGFFRSSVLTSSAVHIMAMYFPEMGLSEEDRASMTIGGYSLAPFQAMGDVVTDGGEVSILRLSEKLRERGIDLSENELDIRATAFDQLVIPEVIGLAINDLRDMGKLGRKWAQKATALYNKHKDTLYTDAYAPAELLKDIATFYDAEAAKVPHGQFRAKRVLSALADFSGMVPGHLLTMAKRTANVYDELGYERPPSLRGLSVNAGARVEDRPEPPEPLAEVEPEPGIGSGVVSEPSVEPEQPTVQDQAEPPQPEGVPELPEEVSEADDMPEAVEATVEDVALGGLATHTSDEAFKRAVFNKLDEIILPSESEGITPGSFGDRLREIADDAAGETSDGDRTVMWARLNDLVTLSTEYGGKLYRSKKDTLGGGPPYFVAVFEYESETIAVAETPVNRNATYVVIQSQTPGTWLEVLTLTRHDARDVGAARIYHAHTAPHGERHLQKIRDLITLRSLHTTDTSDEAPDETTGQGETE